MWNRTQEFHLKCLCCPLNSKSFFSGYFLRIKQIFENRTGSCAGLLTVLNCSPPPEFSPSMIADYFTALIMKGESHNRSSIEKFLCVSICHHVCVSCAVCVCVYACVCSCIQYVIMSSWVAQCSDLAQPRSRLQAQWRPIARGVAPEPRPSRTQQPIALREPGIAKHRCFCWICAKLNNEIVENRNWTKQGVAWERPPLETQQPVGLPEPGIE